MVRLAGALAGVCVTTGLVLAALGLYGIQVPPARPASRWRALVRGLAGWARGRGRGRWLILGVTAGLLALVVTGWPVAAVATAAAVVWLPRLASQSDAEELIARLDGLAEWTRRVADVLTSGAGGLEQAVVMSARTCPPAIAEQVGALAARARVRGLEPALRAFADDLDDPMGDRVAAALILRTHAGGRGLVDVLDALASSIAEEVRARRLVEADRTKPRTSTRAIIAITAVVLAGLVVFARNYLDPFSTASGQLVLAVIAAVFGCALVWMRRLTQPQHAGRFLPPGHRDRTGTAPPNVGDEVRR